jgi:hypothetical protein
VPIFELVALRVVGEKCRRESDARLPAAQDGSPKVRVRPSHLVDAGVVMQAPSCASTAVALGRSLLRIVQARPGTVLASCAGFAEVELGLAKDGGAR